MIQNLPSPKTKNKGTRVGRGRGTGKGGHTTGRGMKGQKSRSGYSKPTPDFEGGQNPLSKRLPKLRGEGKNSLKGYFQSRQKKVAVQLSELAQTAKASDTITLEYLMENGFVTHVSHKKPIVKILFDKDIDKKLTVEGVAVSAKAKKAIEKAGGKVA
jgi:large subunit ribosomal protein L15